MATFDAENPQRGVLMLVPIWALVAFALLFAVVLAWALLAARGRNPLPFPDNGSRIFAATSAEAKQTVVDLLASHGLRERFRADTSGILRSILWDGTIINVSPPEVAAKLGGATSCIGLVAGDPEAAAQAAAGFFRSRGYAAEVVLDAEPGLPIAFVTTTALAGSVINFRKHVIHMPRPTRASSS